MTHPTEHTTAPPHAVILCGGKGTRLRPYTTVLPKPLVPLGDRPILEVVLEHLRRAGVRRVTLCVGHLAELIRAFFGDGSKFGIEIAYAIEDKPLGTIGPLAFVQDLGEDFLVLNGDVLTDLDPLAFFRNHLDGGADLTIATCRRQVKIDFGVLSVVPGTDTVHGFVEKPTHEYEVSTGVYAMNRRVLAHVVAGEPFGFDDLVLTLLARRRPVRRVLHAGQWLDIGRVEDYEAAQGEAGGGAP